jgi:hypothetical protein
MDTEALRITCAGHTSVELDDLHDLQGELKELSEDNYLKLRNSLTRFGFSFPVFYWESPEGTKYILDAHQRVRVLKVMRNEGITIPPLPADPIHAESLTEAKEKLLLLNSKIGTITQEGFDTFTADMPIEDIADLLSIPEVMIEGQDDSEEKEKSDPIKTQEVVCPQCTHRFTITVD